LVLQLRGTYCTVYIYLKSKELKSKVN